MSVNNIVSQNALREIYLAPFEDIVKNSCPWAIMSAYNSVNGTTMSEHNELLNGVLRGEWGFDGCLVSDWMELQADPWALVFVFSTSRFSPPALRSPGSFSCRGDPSPEDVDESVVNDAVRRVLLLAARAGLLDDADPAVTEFPAPVDGRALCARDRRSFLCTDPQCSHRR